MILNLNEWKKASGTVVVIDVLRAFTTSSYILAEEVNSLHIVKDLRIALHTKRIYPDTILVGEKGGSPIKGFDYDNSPFEVYTNREKFTGKDVVLRSSSGTRGAIQVSKLPLVTEIIAGGFTSANALKKYLKDKKDVTYLITGSRTPDGGPEDIVLAKYLMGDITDWQECENIIANCYSSIHWIKNKYDLSFSTSRNFNFIQRILPCESPNYLKMERGDV